MTRLQDLKFGAKLAISFCGCIFNLLCLTGLGVWGLAAADSAGAKAQLYAHKQNLVTRIDANLSEIALRMAIVAATQKGVAADGLLALRKQYLADLDYLEEKATTDDDRGHLRQIEQIVGPWQEWNDRIIEDVRSGKRIDMVKTGNESLARFSVVKDVITDYLAYRQRRLDLFEQEQKVATSRERIWMGIVALAAILSAAVMGVFITRGFVGPFAQSVALVKSVADGDLTRNVHPQFLERRDEIGALAKAVDTMGRGLREMVGNIVQEIGVLSNSASELSTNAAAVSQGSTQASQESHSVAAAAEQMTANAVSVAGGMEQTTANLGGVATATEEMTSTIGEIARNSERARRITEDANRQAASISEQMNHLGAAAREIGKVTETITEISSQTNLLALNATIEAARAGSAGKGFAVVANEIKELAQQTAAATEDIKSRIAGVQSSTAAGIAEIGKISGVIHDVSDIVSSIAAAIEEQSTVTKDIARNIADASAGVGDANSRASETSKAAMDIARGIARVDEEARHITEGSENVRISATAINQVSKELQTMVSRFRISEDNHKSAPVNAIAVNSGWAGRLKGQAVA